VALSFELRHPIAHSIYLKKNKKKSLTVVFRLSPAKKELQATQIFISTKVFKKLF